MKHTTLPLVAKALGEKYDIQVQISGDQAYTNGKIINLPSMPDNKEAALLARGYIDHESAHIRFTDFSIKCSNPMLKCLTNILEDIRIEKILGAKYPGCRSNLKDLAEHLKQQGSFTPSAPATANVSRIRPETVSRSSGSAANPTGAEKGTDRVYRDVEEGFCPLACTDIGLGLDRDGSGSDQGDQAVESAGGVGAAGPDPEVQWERSRSGRGHVPGQTSEKFVVTVPR